MDKARANYSTKNIRINSKFIWFSLLVEFVDLMGDRGFEVGWQIAGALTCFTWAAGTMAIILLFLLLTGKLRSVA